MPRYPSIQHAVIACAPAFECPATTLDSPLPVEGLYSVICVPGQCVQPVVAVDGVPYQSAAQRYLVVYFRHIKNSCMIGIITDSCILRKL